MNRINIFKNHRIWSVAVLCLFVNVSLFAVTFTEKNIKYEVKGTDEVKVIEGWVEDPLIIPDVVSHEGVLYKVTSIGGDIRNSHRYAVSWGTTIDYIKKIVFGKNIQRIEKQAFYNCGFEEVVCNEGLTDIEDEAFYNQHSSSLKINLPEGLLTIGAKAFWGTTLEQTELPSTLTSIGMSAFYYCSKLKNIVIPDGVTNIPEDTFYDCGLETVDVGNGVTTIGASAFGKNNIKQLTLGKKVKKIEKYAFTSCSSIVQIKCLAELPPSCQTDFENSVYENAILYVPKGSRPWYYIGSVWKNFEKIEEKKLIGERCKAPIISIIDNKINITCNTEESTIYYSLKAVDNVEKAKYDEPIMPSTKYILTAYAMTDEFDVSETVSFQFTVIQEDPTKVITIKADNDDASVAVNGKNILISTANNTMQPAIVSTTNGSLVYDGTVSGQSVIPVTQGGIYIVKAGNTSKKVLVK